MYICHNGKKPVEQRYKRLTVSREFERLRADECKMLRMNRSIQAEGSFANIKDFSTDTKIEAVH